MPEETVIIQTEYGANRIVAPSNSKIPKPEKKIEAVAKGTVKKETLAKKIVNEFISCDLKTVGSTAIQNIVVPYAKSMILDILHDGVDMIFGGGSTRPRSAVRTSGNYVSYGAYYSRGSERSVDRRAGYDFKEITFTTRQEVEEIVERMYDILDTDGTVTVADFYALAGIKSVYTDETYGWKNLRSATPSRVRDGYILNLPRPLPL